MFQTQSTFVTHATVYSVPYASLDLTYISHKLVSYIKSIVDDQTCFTLTK